MESIQQQTGKSGEDLAIAFLKDKGYSIITQNYQYSNKSEIDIICKKKNTIIIIEVKSIRMVDFGYAEERIPEKKQRSIIRATYRFLTEYPEFQGKNIRFDLVVVNFYKEPAEVIHYQAAFWQK